ncbi:MAG: isochorismatase family protein [Chloroflexi bacterium]|nr:isochorismatase family protein [Chloroflexota bacterium]
MRSAAFLEYLDEFLVTLPKATLEELVAAAGGPERVALIAVDVIDGFCVEGPLASPRVGRIVPPIERLFRAAYDAGVRAFAVLRDSHDPNAPEFAQFGPHCIAGTQESALVAELANLPFAGSFEDVPKNATSAWVGAEQFANWFTTQREAGVRTFVVTGDCTDLCVYQTAMPLRLGANARNERLEVVVPADGVDTYDLPVDVAKQIGALPHEGDLLHAVFLYHLQLNGVRVVSGIT